MAPEFLKRADEVLAPPPIGSPYSVPIAGTAEEGKSSIYRHWRFKEKLLDTLDPEVLTCHDMFESTANRVPNANCLGLRPWDPTKREFGPYQWETYSTIARRRANFGSGLVEVHRRAGITGRQYGVGLWCQNRPEWQITDLACMSQSLYTVSLYDTLGPTAIEFISNHASLACIVTSLPHIPTLLNLKPRLPHLKIIISLDALEGGEQPGYSKLEVLSKIASSSGIGLYSITQVEKIGESLGVVKFNPPRPEDIVTLNYTSGTTGDPKGVILTHGAAVAASSASLCTCQIRPTDVMCSYLPLAHIYGRVSEQSTMWSGAAIGYFHGNILELVDDFKLLRPTNFISVPRLYNRFGGAIRAATTEQAGVKGGLARHIVSTKLAKLVDQESASATNKHFLYDRIWGKKVTAALGLDRARNMVSGSAPIDPSLHQFLRVVFGNNFIQGYGLTETYAVALAQVAGDFSTGNCGAAAPVNELCLLSVPDMDYLVTDKPEPRGELLVRGNSLFSGYFRNEEETEKSMLPGGWFKTGDICSVDSKGRFKIIDRRKNVLKLAQGEYISPERIENIYLSHLSYLAQAFVHGDSVQTSLVGIFGVAPDLFAPFASKVLGKSIAVTDLQAIAAAAADPKVRKAVVHDLEKVGRKNKFAGYEKVKACYLYLDPFTIDNELLTPTLKLKRPQAARKFRTELDQLYEQSNSEEATKTKAKL